MTAAVRNSLVDLQAQFEAAQKQLDAMDAALRQKREAVGFPENTSLEDIDAIQPVNRTWHENYIDAFHEHSLQKGRVVELERQINALMHKVVVAPAVTAAAKS